MLPQHFANPADSIAVPAHGFAYTPSDSTNILDPNLATGQQEVLARAVTAATDGNLKVTYQGSATAVVIPMLAGVRRSMLIIKIWATDTTVTGDVIVEY